MAPSWEEAVEEVRFQWAPLFALMENPVVVELMGFHMGKS